MPQAPALTDARSVDYFDSPTELISSRDSRLAEAMDTIRSRTDHCPTIGIVLGTGLGGLADEIEESVSFPYRELPGFAESTAIGHRGQLTLGNLAGVPVVAMQGRFHCYEGYSVEEVTFPTRVLHALGIESLILSNAAGGLRPGMRVGDVVVIEDHIDWMFMQSTHDDHSAPGWQPPRQARAGSPYHPLDVETALTRARQCGVRATRGVYAAMTGPNYETRAEYRMLRKLGADVVGMSTVPEALVARDLGLPVLAFSIITNVCSPDALTETTGSAVADAASAGEPGLRAIVRRLLATGSLSKRERS